MSRCPFCGKEVNELRYFTTIVKEYSVVLRGNELNYEEVDTHPDVFGNSYYCCPECGKIITHSTEEAKQFLKGKEIEIKV